ILTQGLNLQIRRMTKALGYQVIELSRIRIMHLDDSDLPVGKWRHLTKKETLILFHNVGRK
ncbi:MAG: 23S rRNA pseudouridine synthase F, partial [Acholeplasmataceae bacterium]|nr:23S rRNA pseudouridine synthase F [Acholeplasmataceae bacterium]